MVSEKKAKGELKAARAKVSQLATLPDVHQAASPALQQGVDEMLPAHQAHIPRVDLHGEGTVV